MLSAEELKVRMGTVGSSDVPAIVGSSPWKTRADVLATKLGVSKVSQREPQFLIGHKLEKPIAELALEMSLIDAKVLFPGWTVVDKEGFASATPDFYAVRDGNMTYRRGRALSEKEAILTEVKVVGHRVLAHWGWGETCAPYVVDQVLWQMKVLRHSRAKVVALMAGAEVKVFDVEMDEVRLRKIEVACREFWEREIKTPSKAEPWARVALARKQRQVAA